MNENICSDGSGLECLVWLTLRLSSSAISIQCSVALRVPPQERAQLLTVGRGRNGCTRGFHATEAIP